MVHGWACTPAAHVRRPATGTWVRSRDRSRWPWAGPVWPDWGGVSAGPSCRAGCHGRGPHSLGAASSSVWVSVAPRCLPDLGLRVCPAFLEDSGYPPLAWALPPLRSPGSPHWVSALTVPQGRPTQAAGEHPSRVFAFVVAAGAVKPGERGQHRALVSREAHSSQPLALHPSPLDPGPSPVRARAPGLRPCGFASWSLSLGYCVRPMLRGPGPALPMEQVATAA